MLGSSKPPTTIFASNDDTAAAAISVAREMGLRLPDQLSVAGFADAPVASMIWPHPQLTTIRQPVTAMARTATDLIIEHSPRRNGWRSPMSRRDAIHQRQVETTWARDHRSSQYRAQFQ
jgi:LacI family transcriptional regulator